METWGPWETESALLREDTMVLSEAEHDRNLSCWEKGMEEWFQLIGEASKVTPDSIFRQFYFFASHFTAQGQ